MASAMGGGTDVFMPVLDGQLCGDNGGGRSVAVFDGFQEITAFLGDHGCNTKIDENKDLNYCQLLCDLWLGAILPW
jgi:hypothetical protein